MRTYCFALDLKDAPALIAEYKRWRQFDTIWPEVLEHIKGLGSSARRFISPATAFS